MAFNLAVRKWLFGAPWLRKGIDSPLERTTTLMMKG